MILHCHLLLVLLAVVVGLTASLTDGARDTSAPTLSVSGVSLVHQFEETVTLNNIAIRDNGQILLLSQYDNNIRILEPTPNATSVQLVPVPVTYLFAITEISSDEFVVLGVNNSKYAPLVYVEYSLWKVQMSGKDPVKVNITKIGELDKIYFYLSIWWADMSYMPHPNASDGDNGSLFITFANRYQNSYISRYDLGDGSYHPFAFAENDALFNYTDGCAGAGIYGTAPGKDDTLWFTNNGKGLTGRIKLQPNGTAASEAQKVCEAPRNPQNTSCPSIYFFKMALDSDENQWIATETSGKVGKATEVGAYADAFDLSALGAWPIAVAFGKGDRSKLLYIASELSTNGTNPIGGAVYVADTDQ